MSAPKASTNVACFVGETAQELSPLVAPPRTSCEPSEDVLFEEKLWIRWCFC